jgi:hypothetical protein
MFVYGDWKQPNKLEGLHRISVPKLGYVWPIMGQLEDNEEFSERLIEKPDLHLVLWQKNFLHAFFNMVQYILHYHRINNDAYFVIMFGLDYREEDKEINHAKFILKLLDDKKIKYELVYLKEESIVVKDATYMSVIPFSSFVFKEVYDYCSTKINRVKSPNKVAYLARSKVPPKAENSIFNGKDQNSFRIKNDLRIEDEEVLIEYFKQKGFDIVYPEDFASFEEQIIYFDSVKAMICPSGSGMANMMFLQPSQIVVELQTPVLIGGTQQVHPFYEGFAWAKKHNLITIPHERKSEHIIEYFEKRKFLEYL